METDFFMEYELRPKKQLTL